MTTGPTTKHNTAAELEHENGIATTTSTATDTPISAPAFTPRKRTDSMASNQSNRLSDTGSARRGSGGSNLSRKNSAGSNFSDSKARQSRKKSMGSRRAKNAPTIQVPTPLALCTFSPTASFQLEMEEGTTQSLPTPTNPRFLLTPQNITTVTTSRHNKGRNNHSAALRQASQPYSPMSVSAHLQTPMLWAEDRPNPMGQSLTTFPTQREMEESFNLTLIQDSQQNLGMGNQYQPSYSRNNRIDSPPYKPGQNNQRRAQNQHQQNQKQLLDQFLTQQASTDLDLINNSKFVMSMKHEAQQEQLLLRQQMERHEFQQQQQQQELQNQQHVKQMLQLQQQQMHIPNQLSNLHMEQKNNIKVMKQGEGYSDQATKARGPLSTAERRLLLAIESYLLDDKVNIYQGSMPVVVVQRVVQEQAKEEYDTVVNGTFQKSFHRFIGLHSQFKLFHYPQSLIDQHKLVHCTPHEGRLCFSDIDTNEMTIRDTKMAQWKSEKWEEVFAEVTSILSKEPVSMKQLLASFKEPEKVEKFGCVLPSNHSLRQLLKKQPDRFVVMPDATVKLPEQLTQDEKREWHQKIQDINKKKSQQQQKEHQKEHQKEQQHNLHQTHQPHQHQHQHQLQQQTLAQAQIQPQQIQQQISRAPSSQGTPESRHASWGITSPSTHSAPLMVESSIGDFSPQSQCSRYLSPEVGYQRYQPVQQQIHNTVRQTPSPQMNAMASPTGMTQQAVAIQQQLNMNMVPQVNFSNQLQNQSFNLTRDTYEPSITSSPSTLGASQPPSFASTPQISHLCVDQPFIRAPTQGNMQFAPTMITNSPISIQQDAFQRINLERKLSQHTTFVGAAGAVNNQFSFPTSFVHA